MSERTRQLDAYWGVRDGKRWIVAISEQQLRKSLENFWAYSDSPVGWTIERSSEIVPVTSGKSFVAERSVIEAGTGRVLADGIAAPHVAWECPHCGRPHTTDLCDDSECKSDPLTSPQLWACEYGGEEWKLVVVEW